MTSRTRRRRHLRIRAAALSAAVTAAAVLGSSAALPPAEAENLPGGPLWTWPPRAAAADPRGDAIEAYVSVYDAALRVPVGWTGSVATCDPGTTSPAFEDATLDAVNYFRRAAGLGSVALDAGMSADAQAAALLMHANGDLRHDPPPSWACYTAAGGRAASMSNLAAAPGTTAVTRYMADESVSSLGHRRWILYPPTRTMGAGSTDGYSALWVVSEMSPRPASPGFVAWPPAGHVPYQHVFTRWSFAPNASQADLSAATVTMTRNGDPVPVSPASVAMGYGDATLSWTPVGLSFGPGMADSVVHVTVTGVVIADFEAQYEYDVIVVDPDNRGLKCGGLPATIVGTDAGETLIGTEGDDVIVGKGGGDVIHGGGGDDVVCGGGGNDVLDGGSGRDRLIGEAGADTMTGGSGNDWADYITAPGAVTVDLVADVADGGAGHDALYSVENVRGSVFDDVLVGNSRNNRLYGMRGGDFIDGKGGSDLILGGPGPDVLQGRSGDDTIIGDLGPDTVLYRDATRPVVVDLIAGTATGGSGSDILRTVEHVSGSRFGDVIVGTTGGNVLRGMGGRDDLYGRGGDDYLLGGGSIDAGHGGLGADVCRTETTVAC